MDNVTYRKNVFKTLSIKPAKLGLRFVSRNTARTNVFHAGLGLFTESAELVSGLSTYLLGSTRLTEPMKINAFEEMGDIGYYLSVIAKSLKAKLPSSGKKVRLTGMTRSEAILKLLKASADIGDLSKKVLYGPEMMKKASGSEVLVIDVVASNALYEDRNAKIKAILEKDFIPVYWALCFDMFDVPPSNLFVGNIAKLSKRYGEGMFQLSEAEHRDTEEEMDAMTTAAN